MFKTLVIVPAAAAVCNNFAGHSVWDFKGSHSMHRVDARSKWVEGEDEYMKELQDVEQVSYGLVAVLQYMQWLG